MPATGKKKKKKKSKDSSRRKSQVELSSSPSARPSVDGQDNGPWEEKDVVDQTLRDRIAELKTTVMALENYNRTLRNKRRSNMKNEFQFHEYFSEEVKKRETESLNLERDLEVQKKAYETRHKEIKVHFESQIKAIEQKTARTKEYLTSEKLACENELKSLSMQEAKEKRFAFDKEVTSLRREIEKKASTYAEEENVLERELLAKKAKLQIQLQNDLEDFEHKSLDIAKQRWIEKGIGIQKDNVTLKIQLKKMRVDAQRQAREKEHLDRKIKDMSLELSLSKDRASLIRKRARARRDGLQTETKRLLALELDIADSVKRSEFETKALSSKRRRELEDFRISDAAISELLKRKISELAEVQRVAQKLVRDRTAVERFFFDALQYVEVRKSEEAVLERTRQKRAVRRASLSLLKKNGQRGGRKARGPIYSRSAKLPDAESVVNVERLLDGEDEVDLRELSWNDRGRLLKLLFARINSVDARSRHVSGRSRRAMEDIMATGEAISESPDSEEELGGIRDRKPGATKGLMPGLV